MYKLTELKRKAKKNLLNSFYHDGESYQNIIFSYRKQVMINITSFYHDSNVDLVKLWDFFKKENHLQYDDDTKIQVNTCYNRSSLDFFNKLIEGNKKEYILLDTNIIYTDKKNVTYKIYKTNENDLYKIDVNLLDFIDLSKVILYKNKDDENICYICNKTFDTLGVCMIKPFEKSELLELL